MVLGVLSGIKIGIKIEKKEKGGPRRGPSCSFLPEKNTSLPGIPVRRYANFDPLWNNF